MVLGVARNYPGKVLLFNLEYDDDDVNRGFHTSGHFI